MTMLAKVQAQKNEIKSSFNTSLSNFGLVSDEYYSISSQRQIIEANCIEELVKH
jgi:hypothetical protein